MASVLSSIKILRQLSSSIKILWPTPQPVSWGEYSPWAEKFGKYPSRQAPRWPDEPSGHPQEVCMGAVTLGIRPQIILYIATWICCKGRTEETNCQSRRTPCTLTGVCGPEIFGHWGLPDRAHCAYQRLSNASVCRVVRHLCGLVEKNAEVYQFPSRKCVIQGFISQQVLLSWHTVTFIVYMF